MTEKRETELWAKRFSLQYPGESSWNFRCGAEESSGLDVKRGESLEQWFCWSHGFGLGCSVRGRGMTRKWAGNWTWTSLVVQWIRICLPMQGTWVWSLVWEDSTCHRITKPVHHNYWASVLQPLKPAYLGPVLHNKRSHCHEEQRVAPDSCNERKLAQSSEDPEQLEEKKKTAPGTESVYQLALLSVHPQLVSQ